jgi:hypothetical protein
MILKVGEKEYKIKYDISALITLEEIEGVAISEVMNRTMGIKFLRNLLYAGLERNHKGITLDSTSDIIQEYMETNGDMDTLTQILLKAFEKSSLVDKRKK